MQVSRNNAKLKSEGSSQEPNMGAKPSTPIAPLLSDDNAGIEEIIPETQEEIVDECAKKINFVLPENVISCRANSKMVSFLNQLRSLERIQ